MVEPGYANAMNSIQMPTNGPHSSRFCRDVLRYSKFLYKALNHVLCILDRSPNPRLSLYASQRLEREKSAKGENGRESGPNEVILNPHTRPLAAHCKGTTWDSYFY